MAVCKNDTNTFASLNYTKVFYQSAQFKITVSFNEFRLRKTVKCNWIVLEG